MATTAETPHPNTRAHKCINIYIQHIKYIVSIVIDAAFVSADLNELMHYAEHEQLPLSRFVLLNATRQVDD